MQLPHLDTTGDGVCAICGVRDCHQWSGGTLHPIDQHRPFTPPPDPFPDGEPEDDQCSQP